MNRKDLVRETAYLLRKNDVKMDVSIPKHVFHISDDEGNTRDFVVKSSNRRYIYNADDINAILEAFLVTIQDTLRRGEVVNIQGFGKFWMKYRKARATKNLQTGEMVPVKARFVPWFTPGKETKQTAKLYQLDQEDKGLFPPKEFLDVQPDEDGDD